MGCSCTASPCHRERPALCDRDRMTTAMLSQNNAELIISSAHSVALRTFVVTFYSFSFSAIFSKLLCSVLCIQCSLQYQTKTKSQILSFPCLLLLSLLQNEKNLTQELIICAQNSRKDIESQHKITFLFPV